MTLLCQYRYDALDRLIGQTPANEAQLQRFYCKSRLATEIHGALRHSIVQHGDLLLAQQQNAGGAFDTTLLTTDQQRSVLHMLKRTQQPRSVAYSPYGHRRPENGLLSLMGFNGEQPDPVTGHYPLGNGYRFFNPVLMRFNSPDSWSPFGKGGLNSYTYCGGEPINRVDSNGHSWTLARFFTHLFSKKTDFSETRMWKNLIKTADSNIAAKTPGSRMSPFTMDAIKLAKHRSEEEFGTLSQNASSLNMTPEEYATNKILWHQQYNVYDYYHLDGLDIITHTRNNISRIDRKMAVLTDLRDGFKHPEAQAHLDVYSTERIREVSNLNRLLNAPPAYVALPPYDALVPRVAPPSYENAMKAIRKS